MRTLVIASATLFALAAAGEAAAGTVTRNVDLGEIFATTALTGFSTTGAGMVGTQVTAFFTDGTSANLTWAATGPRSGGVFGSGWQITQSGDTYISPWLFENDTAAIQRLVINGRSGNTVFDIGTAPSAPESFAGRFFENVVAPDEVDIAATYRNAVMVNGQLYSDLFTTLDLTFTNTLAPGTGFPTEAGMTFLADTDASADEIEPPPPPVDGVPAPASLPLLAAGLAALGWLRRRLA